MKCNVCVSSKLEPVLSLPGYPLNSVYLSRENVSKTARYNPKKLELYICRDCGHFQAQSEVALSELYNDEYNYNTQNSGVQGRIGFFLEQLEQVAGIEFNRVIDIGCFDLSLIKAVKQKIRAKLFIGIDPAIPVKYLKNEDGILCFKDYADNVEIPGFDKDLPDLIISDQTFEHIPDINATLGNIMNKVSDNSLFAVCVPSMEVLIEKLNFHNLIHEHVNYFSINTLAGLFRLNAASLKNFCFNYISTCGFLFGLFIKDGLKSNKALVVENTVDREYFTRHYDLFKRSIENTLHLVESIKNESIYGFGASDITANLAYFMDTDFNFLSNIFDDTVYKKGMYYPFLKPEITGIQDDVDLSNSTCLITAPQAARFIYNRINKLKFKRILNPIGVVA